MGRRHARRAAFRATGARRGRRQQPPAIGGERAATLAPDTDLVAVHDAVRPFIDLATIDKVLDEAAETGAAIVGVPRWIP